MNGRDRQRLSAIERDCLELATAVGAARAAIERGGSAAIATLAERLTGLLAALATLPASGQAAHLGRLLAICEEIEALGGAIDADCHDCREQLARSVAGTRAARAYSSRALR